MRPLRRIETVEGLKPADLSPAELLRAQRPVVLKGLVADWPLVDAGRAGPQAAMDYLRSFDRGRPVVAFTAGPEARGRFFYDEALTRMDFQAARVELASCLDRIAATLDDPEAPAVYVGSTDADGYLPGFRSANRLPVDDAAFGGAPLVSLWIGNRTVAATHYDMSNNIACVGVGRRRFTLFPPDQVANLYPGPLEPTPGGQVVSMVDLAAPDLDRYPRFADALAHAQVAELEPGDVLFYPALWWHNVEAIDSFNVMVNYWWNTSPRFVDSPMTTLLHGLLSLRDRPEAEKQAWRAMFEWYVFGDPAQAGAHLPEHARGPLARLDEMRARRLRARILDKLNR